MDEAAPLDPPDVTAIELKLSLGDSELPGLDKLPTLSVREAKLLSEAPWVRSLGKLGLEVSTQGWRFPVPLEPSLRPGAEIHRHPAAEEARRKPRGDRPLTRIKPPRDAVVFKERLLYALQPPLENLFAGREVQLPMKPYPYQIEGIAFLMPRHAALLADEMGLGKTMQAIVGIRLLLHAGLARRVLVVCPKPLVHNWSRELGVWADDVPFEVIGGDAAARRAGWFASNAPLKLVNYEMLSRDADLVTDPRVRFDLVVLDEAQRIKNRGSKTAQVIRKIDRGRSWALTGTPIENRCEDLINIFAFVDEGRIPPETPAKRLPALTSDCILRRTKDDVLEDLPPKTVRDEYIELTSAQRSAYELAEKEGVVRLNALGDTITVQHVFELVMRLKQICNFDPFTRQSAKLEQMQAELAEVAASGRKAIIFSQWVEPLEYLAEALKDYGPLSFHGKVPTKQRQAVLDRFKSDPSKHLILMSYATGSVGLNLQFANYVFLFDRWWNPAVEDQAINRA
ncbi:MAG: DEAD/DEAH box helicase, partial [Gemmataceae bacterium]